MKTFVGHPLLSCLGLLAMAVAAPSVHAQYYYNPYAVYYQNQLAQQMWMSQAYSQAYYGMGAYNRPYMPPSFPMSPTTPVDPSYGVMPTNPYMPSGPGYGVAPTPYGSGGYDNLYGGGYNPYSYYGSGGMLMGSADVIRAYGGHMMKAEQARILREQALQAKIDTRKKQFEFDAYVKSVTPTYTQEKERVAKSVLRRVLTNPLPGEIANGMAINTILDDLRSNSTKKSALEPQLLSEGVLTHLNVTKSTVGLSVLRNDGRVAWPTAVLERMKPEQAKVLDQRVQELVKEAMNGKLDKAGLADVRKEIEKVREELVAKVNEIPTSQYLDAKRFLQEFNQGTIALERGEAPAQAKFQRFIEGGKSIQEVVDYLVLYGLRVGPATADDEAAYRAVHSALAAYDIALNGQSGFDGKEP